MGTSADSKESKVLKHVHEVLQKHFEENPDTNAVNAASVKTDEGKEYGLEKDDMAGLFDDAEEMAEGPHDEEEEAKYGEDAIKGMMRFKGGKRY